MKVRFIERAETVPLAVADASRRDERLMEVTGGRIFPARDTMSDAAKAAELWDLAKIDNGARSVHLCQDSAERGEGKLWYASAPNGDTDSYGLYDNYTAEDPDPTVAVAKVLAMVAEDLEDWK